jgi:hypothetical protein
MLDKNRGNSTLPSGSPSQEATDDLGLTQPDHKLGFPPPIHIILTTPPPVVLFQQPLGHKLSREVPLEPLAADNLTQTL